MIEKRTTDELLGLVVFFSLVIIFSICIILLILFSNKMNKTQVHENEIEEGHMFSVISNRSILNLFYNGDITYSYYDDEGKHITIRVREDDFIKYFKETYKEKEDD